MPPSTDKKGGKLPLAALRPGVCRADEAAIQISEQCKPGKTVLYDRSVIILS